MVSNYLQPNFLIARTKKLINLLVLIFSISFLQAQTGDYRQNCSNFDVFNKDGYTYELWQSTDATYDGCMITKNNGDFYVQWTTMRNTLARKAKRPGVPNQKIDFYVDNNFSGNVFYGAYGWWRNPGASGHAAAVEYYVVENYGVNKPTDGMPKVGEVTSDGGTYEIYIGNKTGQPSVYSGITNFTQIKCIRKANSLRSSGAITMANHFNAWAQNGWPIGDLYEVSMKIEGYSNGPTTDPCSGNAYVVANMTTAGSYNPNQGNTNNGSGIISGTYRLKAKSGGRYATSNNIEGAEVKETGYEDWSSQHWEFQHITGNEYRLKEKYGNRYLRGYNTAGTTVTVRDLRSTWESQKWILEHISGSEYRLKCKWGGTYLFSPNNNWGTLKVQNFTVHNNRIWILEPVAETKSAAISTTDTIDKKIDLYPNPANDIINLQFTGYELKNSSSLTIYDMQGRAIHTRTDLQSITTINTSQLSSGNYLIQITTDQESYTKQFYKN